MIRNLLAGLALGLAGTALADGDAAPQPAAPAADTGSKTCIHETGSRLPRKAGECLAVPGRSYDSQDLQNTGAVDLSEALRQLDSSVTVRR